MSVSLLLEKYFFTRLNVEAHLPQKSKGEDRSTGNAHSHVHLEFNPVKTNEGLFQLTLSVKIEPSDKEEGSIPYTAEVVTVGFFTVPDHAKEPLELEKLVKVTGGSILYSAVREQILTMTARGPFPPMQLPTINLVSAVDISSESKEQNREEGVTKD